MVGDLVAFFWRVERDFGNGEVLEIMYLMRQKPFQLFKFLFVVWGKKDGVVFDYK